MKTSSCTTILNLTNFEIYNYNQALSALNLEITLPVKMGFWISKNKRRFFELAQELDAMRKNIAMKYGELDDDNQLIVPPDKINIVNTELQELFSLKQEVEINLIPLSWFEKIELPAKEIELLSCMITEEEL